MEVSHVSHTYVCYVHTHNAHTVNKVQNQLSISKPQAQGDVPTQLKEVKKKNVRMKNQSLSNNTLHTHSKQSFSTLQRILRTCWTTASVIESPNTEKFCY